MEGAPADRERADSADPRAVQERRNPNPFFFCILGVESHSLRRLSCYGDRDPIIRSGKFTVCDDYQSCVSNEPPTKKMISCDWSRRFKQQRQDVLYKTMSYLRQAIRKSVLESRHRTLASLLSVKPKGLEVLTGEPLTTTRKQSGAIERIWCSQIQSIHVSRKWYPHDDFNLCCAC